MPLIRSNLDKESMKVLLPLAFSALLIAGCTAPETPLRVEADVVFPSEVQDLWIKLRASQNATSAYAQYKNNYVDLRCVVTVDRASLRVLENQGYLLADVPPRGSVAKIGGYTVLYIGTAR